MKKFLALLLVAVMVFTLAACGGENSEMPNGGSSQTGGGENGEGGAGTDAYAANVFAPDRVKTTTGGVSTVNNLANTYYKLTNEKEFTIGYTGGSVTDGSGGTGGYCWRAGVTDWFKKTYPNVKITEADGSQGNKSSLWGFFRADDWTKKGQEGSLIDMKPDLVFLEFAINDYYVRMSEQRAIHYMEGLINKIRNTLPETDIIIVFITDEASIGKDVPTTMAAQRELAAHYGIPIIDVGAAMNDYIKSSGIAFSKLFTDNVHPNNDGYKIYENCITNYLTDKLITNPPQTSGLKNCEMPKNWLLSGGSADSDMIVASEFEKMATITNYQLLNAPGNAVASFGPQIYSTTGSTFEFDIEGTGLALMIDAPTASLVKCTIDGKETVSVQVVNSIHAELLIADNLERGKHHIKMEIVNGKRFIIGAVLIEK